MKKLFILCALLLCASPALCLTLSRDTTWQGQREIREEVRVEAGATLTIRATDAAGAFAEDDLQLTVTAVNDSPSFSKGADQVVLENAGPETVAGWASAISGKT